ncbi:Pyranose dehydrogenase 3 [Cytospora mali]|uniref:Pyranose dehydrogenase 3 n=1 Tax=Cytospora mali TaxID=578113 RepID=A0A194WBR9_CYTMA|nr:Pyranose dehydrogenase 3 [Valsa mali]
MTSGTYDHIIIGGGLSGCVLASRLRQYKPEARILLIEAGQDTRARTDILQPNVLNLGGELDWMYPTEPIASLSGRELVYNAGKGLGGGTLINSGGWMRGSADDYDEWAAVVGDERWSYKGQLPYMRKTEEWFDDSNPGHHGKDGPILVASTASTGRKFPLTDRIAEAWDELGVPALPNFDHNCGDNLGRAYLCEARRDGKRQHSARNYSLEGVEVLVNALVRKVVVERAGPTPKATGVELADGKVISGKNVVCCGGALRSPQLLMLSGIGASAHLEEHGVEAVVDLPEVGQGLHDHMSLYQFWKLKNPEKGYTIGSDNPIFQQPQFAKGVPVDWIVSTDIPHAGLAEAIEKDEGRAPDPATHRLLSKARTHMETVVLYFKLPVPGVAPDAEHLTSMSVPFLPTSRGSVTLKSADPKDGPKIDLNFLATETDKYVYREGLRLLTRLMLQTKFGKEYVEGESVPPVPGMEALSLDDSDEKLDKRIALAGVTTWHSAGTCAMGKVVDTEFRVKGVEGLRVVDASVIPVPLSAHIQAPVYYMTEQAAVIIAGKA